METLTKLMEFITIEATVALTAAVPMIEVRGAIPVGVAMGLHPWNALGMALLGSMIPVPFILFLIRPVLQLMLKSNYFKEFVQRLTHKTLGKSEKVRRYGFWGLLLFVAIPLPGTGVWSGSLAAALLDMRFKIAFPAIFLGNIIAGLIMTALSYGVVKTIG